MVTAPTGIKWCWKKKTWKQISVPLKQNYAELWLPSRLLAIYKLFQATPSTPHEFLNKSISRILFISAPCTAIILLLWLHPLCHLSPSVPFFTGQHQIFIASLFFNKLSIPISQPPFKLVFHLQVKKGIHLFFIQPNFFPLMSLNSNTLNFLFDSSFTLYCHSVHSIPALCLFFFFPHHLMPSSQTLLLLLRSACWNTQWKTGAGVAAGMSAWPDAGVSAAEAGAISLSGQQQWWWSSARCSSAPQVLYGPLSPPLSSPDPGKKMIVLCFWPGLMILWVGDTLFLYADLR